ncbi:unnamed protein product [Oikopleura dioica]|uniref:Uncharacterized protein n=1 Tax=Oikopleura dioica TaxID=34765 RepID=E4XT22_OIKDI|nr:unnamed protein product [Oikopleura dioica]
MEDEYMKIVKYNVHIDLTRHEKGVLSKEEIDKEAIDQILQFDNATNQYIGKAPKVYFEVENKNNKALGRIVGWITDVFIRLEARKSAASDNIEFTLDDLTEWLSTDCVTVFAFTEKQSDSGRKEHHGHIIPSKRLCNIVRCYLLNAAR